MTRLDDIAIFLTVVERRGFTAAAQALGMPLATVSRKVRDLEARLGVQLIRRTTRSMSLTDIGKAFAVGAAEGVAQIDAAESAARAVTKAPEGTLRVLAPIPAAKAIEPTILSYRRQFPNVNLNLTLDNRPLDLAEHGFDIAFRVDLLPLGDHTMRRLGTLRRILVASPAFLDRVGVPAHPREVVDHPCLLVYTDGRRPRWTMTNGSERVTVDPPLGVSLNDSQWAVDFALEGEGFLLVGEVILRDHLASRRLVHVLPAWRAADDASLVLLTPRRATNDAKVRAFIDVAVPLARRLFRERA